MLVTEFYDGQGLGNQLWCYVTTRLLAKKRGLDFGIQSPERFKGFDFLDLDMGKQVFGGKGIQGRPPYELPQGITHYYVERGIFHPDGTDIRMFDENLLKIPDNTKIDGIFQDSDMIEPYKEEIRSWLKVLPEAECFDYSSDDICVINFRGGGYVLDKKFFLTQKYWDDAILHMKTINPTFKFVVVTDDTKTAKKFFPNFEVNHWNTAKDYVVIKNAHYLILSNSSFAQFPAFTSTRLKYCLAPKYWTRHNTSDGAWSLGYNIAPGFHYLDRKGNVSDYKTCRKEFDGYITRNKGAFSYRVEFDPLKPYTPPAKIEAKKTSSLRATLFRIRSKAVTIWRRIAANPYIDALVMGLREKKTKQGWKTPEEIVEYRRKIKIYDIFTFFNELDMLELRLEILGPHVDYFVLVESPKTFSGKPMPLFYEQNKDRYKKWHPKIIHYVTYDVPETEDELRGRLHDKIPKTAQEKLTIKYTLQSHTLGAEKHWFREFYIKESARKAIEGIKDEDFCFVSDLDEIWNPELLVDYSKDDVFKPVQKPYAYFLNNRTNENWRGWTGTIGTKYKNIRTSCLNNLRTHRLMISKYSFLRNGGWHFTFQGGYEGAKRKLVDTNHVWYKPTETLPKLMQWVKENKDPRGRNVKLWVDETGLPEFILKNKEKYKTFFR